MTYFIRERIFVLLTSCLTGLNLTKQVNIIVIQYEQTS